MNMRVLMGTLALALALAACGTAALAHEGAPADKPAVPQDIQASIRAAYPGTVIDSVTVSEIPGLYELRMGRNVAYSGPQGRYLLVGHVLDTQTGQDVTQQRLDRSSSRTLPWDALPLSAAIRSGVPGAAKLAVFTDPDCGYCRRLRAELAQLQDIEVYEILYPIAQLHPQALDKSRAILCSPDPVAALAQAMRDQPVAAPSPDCDTRALDAALRFGEAHAIKGTPTLVRGDGAVIEGMRPVRDIQAWVQQAPSAGAVASGSMP